MFKTQQQIHFIDAPIALAPRLIYRLSYLVIFLLAIYAAVMSANTGALLQTVAYFVALFAMLQATKLAHVAHKDGLAFCIFVGFVISVFGGVL